MDCTHFMFCSHAPMALILHVIVIMASGVIKNFLLIPWILLNRATDSLELWFLLLLETVQSNETVGANKPWSDFTLKSFLNSLLLLYIQIVCLYSNEITVLLEPSRTQKILSLSVLKRCMNHGNDVALRVSGGLMIHKTTSIFISTCWQPFACHWQP